MGNSSSGSSHHHHHHPSNSGYSPLPLPYPPAAVAVAAAVAASASSSASSGSGSSPLGGGHGSAVSYGGGGNYNNHENIQSSNASSCHPNSQTAHWANGGRSSHLLPQNHFGSSESQVGSLNTPRLNYLPAYTLLHKVFEYIIQVGTTICVMVRSESSSAVLMLQSFLLSPLRLLLTFDSESWTLQNRRVSIHMENNGMVTLQRFDDSLGYTNYRDRIGLWGPPKNIRKQSLPASSSATQ